MQVDIAVGFVLESGVRLLEEHLRDVLARGGRVRVLTGDYLDVTEPDALLRLLDLGQGLDLRVHEGAGTSFHLKSYVLCDDVGFRGTAFVGSSNLSRTALLDGVEWNYRVITSRDGEGFRTVRAEYERLFGHPRIVAVDAAWIARYRARRRARALAEAGVAEPPPPPPPVPHAVQQEALAALVATRATGNAAGLVVLATGLGKTWLAAFDTERAAARRVLFVAHRDEILDQALRTFRTIRPHATLGKYTGEEKVADAEVLFASVQTLGRRAHLDRFAPDHFDYVVVDEFHHASATTYRRLLDHFAPSFLLGLTATPERTDGADLLALCGENLVYRCDLVEGIRRGLLSPFDYYGVPDEVDYTNIPWRSGRFDEEELTTHVATRSRADNALEQLARRGGICTIGFCVSQRHADFMRDHFARAGKRVAAVHAGPTSDPRAASLERLQRGGLDVVFAVDMFNEGVDLPDVDTVLMLRPTESRVLWLQQFGRGLRRREGKRLKVVDYIGNHRSFLLKPRTLFQLGEGDVELSAALRMLREGDASNLIPPNCSVTYDLEATEILEALLRRGGAEERRDALVAYYRAFRDRTGVRPTASETWHDGLDPRSARPGYGSWLQFVRAMDDLRGVWDSAEVRLRPFLTSLETTPMTRSFKMVVLLALLAEDGLTTGATIDRLVARVRTLARRSAVLRQEFGDALEDDASLRHLLEQHPIEAWTGGRGTGGERFFSYTNGRFAFAPRIPASEREAANALIRELAEWRLAVYLRRAGVEGAPRILCRVSHADGRPILFLPSRDRTPGVPEGWIEVTADGEAYQAKFAKVAVNVLQRPGDARNVLAEVLRRWFGQGAGLPGTSHAVAFERGAAGYVMSPARSTTDDGPRLWARYARADVPKLFGFEFKGFESQSGVVERPGIILLFVTLEKSGMQEAHRYADRFLTPTELQWQSQNRTKRESEAGRRLAEHATRGIAVHLFVRPVAKLGGVTQPFVYAGRLTFESWEGDNPITVRWRLGAPVPLELRDVLRVAAN
jgi:superfamily II DNA or RNA helicase